MRGVLAERFRGIGLTAAEALVTPPRHAALRDDAAALALRLFRDHARLSAEEDATLAMPAELVFRDEAGASARYRLDFVEQLYLFSDWPSSEPARDEVLPPGETAAILFRAARQFGHVRAALDLGCGSGALGLLLSARADRVMGTDINPRAIELSRLNAVVNGIANADFREGSLFDPVADAQFDLVVSQPPYIPLASGAVASLFLHGGSRGDELARELIAGIPGHLSEHGRALIFSDWPLGADERLADRIPHQGLHARLFASPPVTTESYARNYGEAIASHFAAMGINGVRQCLAVLEQGSGAEESAVEEIEVLPHEWANLRVD